ncbi:MAG: GMC family oxidoreductase [Gammaproteobacteria bacterium]
MVSLSKPLDSIRPHYDVVVVGSGYGGGVAAARLARYGRRVCVLESGKEFPTGKFPDKFQAIRREVQITGSTKKFGPRDGLFDFRIGNDIDVFVGCGLGGGSLINAGVALRPDPRVFEDQSWPEEISSDGLLDEAFERARHMLRPATNPQTRQLTKYKALEQASKPFDAPALPAEVTVNFHDTINAANMPQPACTQCGDCLTGCNVGAKTSVALTYLPLARHYGAEIFTGARVSHVAREDGGWRISYSPTEAKPGDRDKLLSVTAATVVLAAGTLGSTEILLRSREHGLALSKRLGEGFSANGDIIAFGYGADIRVNAIGVGEPPKAETDMVGNCVSGQTRLNEDSALEMGMYLQEGVVPSGLSPLLPIAFIPKGAVLGAAQSLIKGIYDGPFSRLHSFFAVGHDAAAGRMVLKQDRVSVEWPDVNEQPVYKRVDKVMRQATKATGASYVKSPLAAPMMREKPLTAHPLGGCGMGADAQSGVVNHKCQVFRGGDDAGAGSVHPGLYVCDGAIMPRSIGVNPLLSITALAERAMTLMARDNGWHVKRPARRTEPVPAE